MEWDELLPSCKNNQKNYKVGLAFQTLVDIRMYYKGSIKQWDVGAWRGRSMEEAKGPEIDPRHMSFRIWQQWQVKSLENMFCWQNCGRTGALLRCWWECKLMLSGVRRECLSGIKFGIFGISNQATYGFTSSLRHLTSRTVLWRHTATSIRNCLNVRSNWNAHT